MTAAIIVYTCIACGAPSAANPRLVPSIRVSRDADGELQPDPGGPREPICRACADFILRRVARGECDATAVAREPGFLERAFGTADEEDRP